MYKDLDIDTLIHFSQKLKVLYVEDNEDSREALSALLGNFFKNITVAKDGQEALKKFKEERFDLIITDIRMPKMDGIELMQEIRKIDEEIPIIVSTAHKEQELLIECIEIGVEGYLLKPINFKQLSRVIKSVCGRLYYIEETNRYERSLEKLVLQRTKELEDIQERLTKMSHRDPLTNLYNRRYFNEIVNTLMHIAHREKSSLSLLMIDIDKFKNINDTYGHLAGDHVLQKLSQELLRQVRDSDVVIRFGGEEFLVLLPNTDLQGALKTAQKIRSTIESMHILLSDSRKTDIKLTVSIGVTECECLQFLDDKDKLIERADKAMYQAKEEGRNKVVAIAS